MAISIERMIPQSEGAVRALVAKAHPDKPERPAYWFWVNPTFVAFDDGGLVGVTSLHVDQAGKTITLLDTAVDPDVQGRGIGQSLMDHRLSFGDMYGVKQFVGITWEANVRMHKILLRSGFHKCQRVENYYSYMTPPADGIIYIRGGC